MQVRQHLAGQMQVKQHLANKRQISYYLIEDCNQIAVNGDDIHETAITTPIGLYGNFKNRS